MRELSPGRLDPTMCYWEKRVKFYFFLPIPKRTFDSYPITIAAASPLRFSQSVTYWPSTEPSIKRCTCVNKRKNSETGAYGRRYRNFILTCGRRWIRWWWQMRTPTGSRWVSDNYITRCHRRFEPVAVPVGDRMPAEWELAPDRGVGPTVTHGWAAQPEYERSAAMVRRTLGQYVAVCPCLQLTSHTQPTSTLLRIKCERYIFIKKCVHSFIEAVTIVGYVSAYICICIV